MTEAEQMDLGSRVHSVASNVEVILKAASTPDGKDELSMMLKPLVMARWDLGKVLQKIGYGAAKQAAG